MFVAHKSSPRIGTRSSVKGRNETSSSSMRTQVRLSLLCVFVYSVHFVIASPTFFRLIAALARECRSCHCTLSNHIISSHSRTRVVNHPYTACTNRILRVAFLIRDSCYYSGIWETFVWSIISPRVYVQFSGTCALFS